MAANYLPSTLTTPSHPPNHTPPPTPTHTHARSVQGAGAGGPPHQRGSDAVHQGPRRAGDAAPLQEDLRHRRHHPRQGAGDLPLPQGLPPGGAGGRPRDHQLCQLKGDQADRGAHQARGRQLEQAAHAAPLNSSSSLLLLLAAACDICSQSMLCDAWNINMRCAMGVSAATAVRFSLCATAS